MVERSQQAALVLEARAACVALGAAAGLEQLDHVGRRALVGLVLVLRDERAAAAAVHTQRRDEAVAAEVLQLHAGQSMQWQAGSCPWPGRGRNWG
ncbi:MAG: hypothetical protein U0168_15225 [Nannocystaceae bacterium]